MKDFFYNKSDVLIAILIIAIAAVVIYSRVLVIMGYSSTGLIPDSGEPAAVVSDEGSEDLTAEGGADLQTGGSSEDAVETEPIVEEEPVDTQEQEPEVTEPETDPAVVAPAAESIQITVAAGDAAATIADKLLAAGAITDKQAFLSEVMAAGADSKLKIGTFTIPAGSSASEIIAILVG